MIFGFLYPWFSGTIDVNKDVVHQGLKDVPFWNNGDKTDLIH